MQSITQRFVDDGQRMHAEKQNQTNDQCGHLPKLLISLLMESLSADGPCV